MSDKNTSVFAQEAEKGQDSFVQQAVDALAKEVIAAEKILESAKVLFVHNAFPTDTGNAEKEVLKNSLALLGESVETAKKNAEQLLQESQKKHEESKEKKEQIEKEFHAVTEKMSHEITEKMEYLQKEKGKITDELEEIKQLYETKKQELEEKQKEIMEEEEQTKNNAEQQAQMATNALEKAMEEARDTELSREEIEHSAHVFETLQKNINRAKAGLELVFADPNQKETLEKIVNGTFSLS